MKRVTYTDENGYRQAVYVNKLVKHPSEGIPISVPDINVLNWDEIKKEVHNAMVDNELFTWVDVQKKQNAITSILRTVILRKLVALYRMEDKENG